MRLPTRTSHPRSSTTEPAMWFDLLLLRDLTETIMHPSLAEIRAAVEDVFTARAAEAKTTDASPRTWPTTLTAHAHWKQSFDKAAESAGLAITLADAVAQVNAWLKRIENA